MGQKKISRHGTRCNIHIHSRRFRLADPDGISGKAAIDGLVHAKILSDDSAKEVAQVTYSQEKVSKKAGEAEETIITIDKKTGAW